MSFPTWLSWASRQDFGRVGPRRNAAYPVRLLLHSTETGTWPSYSGGADQPHLTIQWNGPVVRGFTVRQHQSLDYGARALLDSNAMPVNSTNTVQVEMVGSCDASFAKRYGYYHLPTLGDDYLADLGAFIVKLAAEIGCPLNVYDQWRDYPSSYGYGAPQRMSWGQWVTFSGICGHEHAPANDHGDPGSINVKRALELAGKSPGVIGRDDGVLMDGDTGDNVKVLQALLNREGAHLTVDGEFGPATTAAVRARQRQIGVAADGVWGPLSAAAEKRAEEAASRDHNRPPITKPTPAPAPLPAAPKFPLPSGHAYAVDDHTNLTHSGIRGNDAANVKRIQRVVGVVADGVFGPRTRAAVKRFQKAHHLTQDGAVGPQTWKALFS